MSESMLGLMRDARRAQREGAAGIARRQRARLVEAVDHARTHSPFYRELHRGLPDRVEDVTRLPVTNKVALMERFDEWVTDERVTHEAARAHTDDPALVGHRLLGEYTVTTTSGTTGRRAIFLMDEHTTRVAVALGLRSAQSMLSPKVIGRLIRGLGRSALIVPTGGHFGTHVGAVQQLNGSKAKARISKIIPVTAPLTELVAQLNELRPAYLEAYPTVAMMLAGEQEAGRLHLRPGIVRLAGEAVSTQDQERIVNAFGAQVLTMYGANETVAMMSRCPHGWYHVHDDWTIFEPVDAEHQPTPAGEWSHTVLISVLYRREQPILRYDLGDRVLRRPDPCPCGSPFTAIQVGGRAADTLRFSANGSDVQLSPLVLETQIERTGDIEVFQLVQTDRQTLRLRMLPRPGSDPDKVWRSAESDLGQLLAEHGLSHVTVERATEPPEQTPGGKYRSIIPLP